VTVARSPGTTSRRCYPEGLAALNGYTLPVNLPPREKVKSPRRRRVRWIIAIVLAVSAAAIVLILLVVAGPHPRSYGIPSSANVPTLKPGDHILVRSGNGNIGRGDFVIFHLPGQKLTRIMRVVAIGGDRVDEGSAGTLDVNGRPDSEPYLPAGTDTENVPTLTVPGGSVFVMGDNRGNSQDSRFLGPVPLQDVVGRAVLRWWPVNRLGGV